MKNNLNSNILGIFCTKKKQNKLNSFLTSAIVSKKLSAIFDEKSGRTTNRSSFTQNLKWKI